MDQRIIDLYDEYTHAPLPRRDFLERLAVLTGGAAAIPAILSQIEPNYAHAALVPENNPGLDAGPTAYPGPVGTVKAYRAAPKGQGKAPAVIVIHENRGLNPYVEDVARRVAKAGFVALAPDLLSPLGGTPADPDQARDLIAKLDRAAVVKDLQAAMTALRADGAVTGTVGAVGFCWGGGIVNQLAVAAPDLDAGVAFYGPTPDPGQVAAIKAPMLLHYAGLDQRINAGIPAYDEALKKAGVKHQIFVYEGVNHAFHNDTSAERYDKAAADLAWDRTVAFLKNALF